MTTTAMATMATVDAATITRTFLPCGLLVKTYGATGRIRSRPSPRPLENQVAR